MALRFLFSCSVSQVAAWQLRVELDLRRVLSESLLTLTLLVARVLANHHDAAVATNHLALVTDLLNAWVDLHRLPSCWLAVSPARLANF